MRETYAGTPLGCGFRLEGKIPVPEASERR